MPHLPLTPSDQVRNTPYMSMSERAVVLREHRRLALEEDPTHAKLAATLAAVKRMGRRTGGTGSMDLLHSKRNQAVSFFWNYNTVESYLLFCAVLVNLAGACRVCWLARECRCRCAVVEPSQSVAESVLEIALTRLMDFAVVCSCPLQV